MSGYEKELERLSVESGKPIDEIKSEIATLVKEEKFDDVTALAVWKSQNSFALGGKTVKNAILRVVGSDKKREVEVNGQQMEVSGFGAFVKDGDRIVFCNFALWKEAADLSESLETGGLYVADVKLKSEGDDGVMKAALIGNSIDSAPPEAAKQMPEVPEILAKYGVESVSTIADHIGSTGFFSGIVGKTFDTKFGGGIEVSDIGGNPVSVFVEDHTQYMVGERLIIYGYVRTSKTGIGIRASGLFKA
jgi:hypothetical protein